MRIPVVFASDNKYAKPLGVSITSLLVNAAPETFYELYVLDGGINEENKKKLIGLKERINKNFDITFIDMSKNKELNNLPIGWHFSSAAYYRLIIPYLKELEKYEKVIYLDCDLIVESDLKELYNVDLKDKVLAAFPEVFAFDGRLFWRDYFDRMFFFKDEIGISLDRTKKYYFNSGVLVINLPFFKKENYLERAIELINKYCAPRNKYKGSYNFFQDQDALNVLVLKEKEDKMVRLGFQWNYLLFLFEGDPHKFRSRNNEYLKFILSNFEENKSDKNLEDLARNFKPKIVHFGGSSKPWNDKLMMYQDEYDRYREVYGWNKDLFIDFENRYVMIKRKLGEFVKARKKEFFLILMVSVLLNMGLIVGYILK